MEPQLEKRLLRDGLADLNFIDPGRNLAGILSYEHSAYGISLWHREDAGSRKSCGR